MDGKKLSACMTQPNLSDKPITRVKLAPSTKRKIASIACNKQAGDTEVEQRGGQPRFNKGSVEVIGD
jgi:hypothetical protein